MKIVKKQNGSFTGKTGKKSPDTTQARQEFDATMNKQFRDTQLVTLLSIKEITKIATFNVRRLAHWINKRSKKMTIECAGWLKTFYGSCGGLVPSRHFVGCEDLTILQFPTFRR